MKKIILRLQILVFLVLLLNACSDSDEAPPNLEPIDHQKFEILEIRERMSSAPEGEFQELRFKYENERLSGYEFWINSSDQPPRNSVKVDYLYSDSLITKYLSYINHENEWLLLSIADLLYEKKQNAGPSQIIQQNLDERTGETRESITDIEYDEKGLVYTVRSADQFLSFTYNEIGGITKSVSQNSDHILQVNYTPNQILNPLASLPYRSGLILMLNPGGTSAYLLNRFENIGLNGNPVTVGIFDYELDTMQRPVQKTLAFSVFDDLGEFVASDTIKTYFKYR